MTSLLTFAGIFFVIPRTILVVLYIFYRWFLNPIPSMLWQVLGFLFAPYSMLWYLAVHNWFGGGWTWWQIVILIIAIGGDWTSATHNMRSLFAKED